MQKYADVHNKEFEQGFIERVPELELSDPNKVFHFINHFPVVRHNSPTTPIRRVFDGSLHAKGQSSLNDMMLKGHQMVSNITSVCLNLRLTKYLATLDISKAFLRLSLHPDDRNYTCFLFRENPTDSNSEIVVWRFTAVLFGCTSSPFLLNCTVSEILSGMDIMERVEVFVDNIFILVNNEDQIIPAVKKLETKFNNHQMPLHEYASNSKVANENFRDEQTIVSVPEIKL